MRYEWQVGLRYLTSTRSELAPSVITVLSVAAVGIGVAVLIFVLSVMGGFEGDLRDKIIGSNAHVLIEGPSHAPLEDPEPVIAAALAHADVVGASPFIESELMVSSPTNYSGVVLRGIDPARVGSATDLERDIRDGRFEWLERPDEARDWAAAEMGMTDYERELAALRDEAATLSANAQSLQDRLANIAATVDAGSSAAERATEASGDPSMPYVVDDGAGGARRTAMPPLTPAGGDRLPYVVDDGAGGTRRSAMPPLTPAGGERLPYTVGPDGVRGQDDTASPAQARVVPGLIIGSELAETLRVDIGDVVDIVNPDGPVGPTGPVPTVRQFRVVGVFYTGLYEYDSRNAYVTLDVARRFLNVPEGEVTGVELRVASMEHAGRVRVELESAFAEAGRPGLMVSDWMQLNSNLFSALLLEKVVMGLLLMIIVLVASFGIVCVLIMIVIQKASEIAILRSMGATRRGILALFVVQGASIGIVGTAVGAIVGLGLTWFLASHGFPLDPEVYYIDRVPVEVDAMEVIAVVGGALVISLLATLYPSMQAARLDPAEGLRLE